jgi:hypothetical protein
MAPEGITETFARVFPQLSAATAEYKLAVAQRADRWVAGCGGNEIPFTYNGRRWLYVFNPATCRHGYLDLDTDIVTFDYRSES